MRTLYMCGLFVSVYFSLSNHVGDFFILSDGREKNVKFGDIEGKITAMKWSSKNLGID